MQIVQIKITKTAVTARYGTLSPGDLLRTDAGFARHLVEDCKAAKYVEREVADEGAGQISPEGFTGTRTVGETISSPIGEVVSSPIGETISSMVGETISSMVGETGTRPSVADLTGQGDVVADREESNAADHKTRKAKK